MRWPSWFVTVLVSLAGIALPACTATEEPAAPPVPVAQATPAQPTDPAAEFAALHDRFWEQWRAWQEAMTAYGSAYQAWADVHRPEFESDAAAWAGFADVQGPAPADPTSDYLPPLQALAERAPPEVGAQVRGLLLNMLGNARRFAEWTDVYVQLIAQTPADEEVGGNARSATYVTEQAGRWPEVHAALLAVLEQHPQGASAPGIRYALAEKAHEGGDLEKARTLYLDVAEQHPGSWEAEQATAAVYEIEHLQPGMPAPAFEAMSFSGQPISLQALRGKVVVLDFWATWCGPCILELPSVVALREAFPPDEVVLIGVSLDREEADLRAFLEERRLPASSQAIQHLVPDKGMDWPQICDFQGWKSELAQLYAVDSIPRTFVIDREGLIAGRDLRGEQLTAEVAKLLGR